MGRHIRKPIRTTSFGYQHNIIRINMNFMVAILCVGVASALAEPGYGYSSYGRSYGGYGGYGYGKREAEATADAEPGYGSYGYGSYGRSYGGYGGYGRSYGGYGRSYGGYGGYGYGK